MNQAAPENIFSGHLLQPRNPEPLAVQKQDEVWPSLLLLFCLVVLAFVKSRGVTRLVRIVQSTFSKQILQQLEREKNATVKVFSMALNGFFIVNFSFLIYKINRSYPLVLPEKAALLQFLFFTALVMIVVLFKRLFLYFLAQFTNSQRLVNDYLTSSSLLNQTFGLFLFPWIILAEFTDFNSMIFVIIACCILLLSFFIKWYRGMILSLVEERVGLLQIFSYFCGLEILPLLVVIKFVIETF